MNDARREAEFAPDAPAPDGCCCWPLWSRLTAAGDRGLAVVVEEQPEGLAFWLQSRGIAFDDEESIRADPIPRSEFHINVSTFSRIRYCPWCGTRLDALAASASETFARFAAAHRTLAAPPV